MALPTPTPFVIAVPEDLLAFITDRVRTGRVPAPLHYADGGGGWSHGLPVQTLAALQDFWTTHYDWRAVEARLNSTFTQFTLPVSAAGEDLTMHFVHHRSARADAIPLLFIHGWPGSFLEAEHILPLLTAPEDSHHQAFHVVAPSLPGFGFSQAPRNAGFSPKKIAAVLDALMQALGYTTYIAQGGDWGSMIARLMAINNPAACVGVHVNFLVATPPSALWNPLEIAWLLLRRFSQPEKAKLQRMMWWQEKECGYYRIMGTKPTTISCALTDSPLGMLAWIREKLEPLVDGHVWTEEQCITWAMMYIVPGGTAPANLYKDGTDTIQADLLDQIIGPSVYFGASSFPKDVGYIPIWWARCKIARNIVFWAEHDRGGHFASVENPALLVADVRAFVGKIEGATWAGLLRSGERGGGGGGDGVEGTAE